MIYLSMYNPSETVIVPTLTCNYFTESIFSKNISSAQTYEITGYPVAAVFPHNEILMDMTASVIKTLSEYDYNTIILLAPNHQAKTARLLISGESWNTPVGIMEGNLKIANKIKAYFGGGIIEETDVVEEDHSASIVMPYIKKFMPHTKVVTLLLNKELSINEVISIGEILNKISKEENILVLGSIDFAHYQDYNTTVLRDNETIRLMNSFNIEQLKVLDGKNIDTSESMGAILTYAKERGIGKINIIEERIVSNSPKTNDYGSYMSIIIEE